MKDEQEINSCKNRVTVFCEFLQLSQLARNILSETMPKIMIKGLFTSSRYNWLGLKLLRRREMVLIQQGVALTGRNTTGPPHAAPL